MRDNGAYSTVPSLKILMTADAVGGVWQYSLDLISELVGRGAHVLLATMGPRPNEAQQQRLAALPAVTLCESDYKLEWMEQPWKDVDSAGAWLLDLAAQFQPDVVHLNGFSHATLSWNVPRVVVAHSCVYSWWQAVHGSAPPQHEWAEYRHRVSGGLRAANAIVAPSAFMATALTTHYGLPTGRAKVIHNFSESPWFSGVEKEPLYFAAGRVWDVGKNLKLLDDIAGRLPWPVRIAGSLPHESVLAEMQRASVYVHPSRYEPFGLAVLEAARAQCCLVLSDIPPLRELWDGAAIFVDPRDPERWAHTLTAIARNEAGRQPLGRLARLRALRYSSAAAVQGYYELYQSLARAEKSASREGEAA
jgi:glycogen synthase